MKKCLSFNFHIWKNVYPTISIYEKKFFLQFLYMKNAYPRVFFFTIFWVYETKKL